MAASAIGRRSPQVRQGTGILMTLFTGNLDVFPGQLEKYILMVEGMPVSVFPVMAGQAVIPESLQM
jgi:hypothetical protein